MPLQTLPFQAAKLSVWPDQSHRLAPSPRQNTPCMTVMKFFYIHDSDSISICAGQACLQTGLLCGPIIACSATVSGSCQKGSPQGS